MERRRERRGILDQSVRVTLLQVTSNSPPVEGAKVAANGTSGRAYQAQTIDQSGRGMRLLVPFQVGLGTTLKIETDDTLMLAEVCHSNRVNDERFAIGVQISQSLKITKQLQRLCDSLAAAGASAGVAEVAGKTTHDKVKVRR